MKQLLNPVLTTLFFLCLHVNVHAQCSLPLNGGTTTSPGGNSCPAMNFFIGISGSSTGSGITYQWESSPDNVNWTTMNGFTSATLSTIQTTTTWYRRKLICSAGGTAYSNSIQIIANPFSTCYCTPIAPSCSIYTITNVSLGALNNNSTCGNGYSDYSATLPALNLARGSFLPISVTTTNPTSGRAVMCHIDFNQNGYFDQSEFTDLNTVSGNVYSSFIRIPFSARLGVTRMRIVYAPLGASGCPLGTSTETEDYYINITPNTTSATGHVIYVKNNAFGSNNTGMDWANATYLENALRMAWPGDTIKIAAGNYLSLTNTAPPSGHVLKDSIYIMGGYPSTGNPVNSDRNFSSYQTIFSGNYNATNWDNHVLIAKDIKNCVVDGVIVQNGGNTSMDEGGGIWIVNSSGIIIRNSVFRNNLEFMPGSAIAVRNSQATFQNCIVTKHVADFYSTIQVRSNSQVNFINCLAAGNKVSTLLDADSSTVNFKNSTIAGNQIGQVMRASNQSNIGLSNSICFFNSVYQSTSKTNIFDTTEVRLFTGATTSFQNSITQVYKNGTSMLMGISPRFRDTGNLAGIDGAYFTSDDGYSLTTPCSPALNAGLNTLASGINTDITGAPRIYGLTVDLGAYELQQAPGAVPAVIYVNPAATGANDGSSWANAYKDLHQALRACSDTIKMAGGVYYPWQSSVNKNYYWIESKRVILGCFPPTGNPGNADRNYTLYPTQIDGTKSDGTKALNIWRGWGLDSTSVVDGLTFSNTDYQPNTKDATVAYLSCNNPVFSNCRFTNNTCRIYWGRENKNPQFINLQVDGNNNITQYSLDLMAMTDCERTTFKKCVFQKNKLITATATAEFGRILFLERTNSFLDSCQFIRNQATGIMNLGSSPTVTNTIFFKNYLGSNPVDLHNQYSSPVFRKCTFTDTVWTAYQGGSMRNYLSQPLFIDCQFYEADADHGGVAYNDSSSSKFNNCVFSGCNNLFYNARSSNMELTNCIVTGAEYNSLSEPILMLNEHSNPIITNCTIANNKATTGGVIYNRNGSGTKVYNTIFWKNFPFYNASNTEVINFLEGTSQYKNCMFEIYNTGSANNNTTGIDPRFNSYPYAIGGDNTWFTFDDGLRVDGCSPAVNSGDNNLITQTNDITGSPRIVGGTVDRGAYEFQSLNPGLGKTIYVHPAANGLNNGSTWDDAYTSLHAALKHVCSDTIKMAAGVYRPAIFSRDSSFVINRNVVILGSYDAATGIADVEAHPTIISGNIGNPADSTDNSYSLVTVQYLDSLKMDGIVFRENVGNKTTAAGYAMSAINIKALYLTNCRFYKNTAINAGGTLTLVNVKKFDLRKVVFSQNKAERGAGVYMSGFDPGVNIIDCIFDRNEASFEGGGVYVDKPWASFTNCLFTGNRAYRGAAMALNNHPTTPITNCSFVDNYLINNGGVGAGIYSTGTGSTSGPYITNSIFTGNTILNQTGQGVYHDLYFAPSGNPPSGGQVKMDIMYSAVTTMPLNGGPGFGLLTPELIKFKNRTNPIGPDGKWFTADDGLQLDACSEGINKGQNSFVDVSKDLAGNARIIGVKVDVGSYEYSGPGCVPTAIPVVNGLQQFIVSPNPSNGMIRVTMELQRPQSVGFSVIDINGKTILQSKPQKISGSYSTMLDLKVAAGVYYLRTMVGGKSFVEKLVVVK